MQALNRAVALSQRRVMHVLGARGAASTAATGARLPSWGASSVSIGSPTPAASRPSHHVGQGRFTNPWPSSREHTPSDIWAMMSDLKMSQMNTTLSAPTEALRHEVLAQPTTDLQVTWLGHATFLVQIGGINILTDPVFSDWVSPFYRLGPHRVTDAPCRPGDLPPIDIVLVSHSHYDHLDLTSLAEMEGASKRNREAGAMVRGVCNGKATERVFSGTRYIAPIRTLGAAKSTNILKYDTVVLDKMDWWQTMDVELPHHSAEAAASSALHLPIHFTHGREIDVPAALPSGELESGAVTDGDGSAAWSFERARSAGEEKIPGSAEVRIVAIPAQHNTQRWFNDRNTSLWSGFAIESSGKRFYFSGDTGYQTVPKGEEEAEHERDDPTVPVPRPVCPAFKQTGAALGPFDACALPIGAYSPRWFMSTVHADTCDAMRMHMELRSKRSVGMHWGTFQLTDEPLLEPIERLEAAAAKMGQTGRFTAEPLGRTMELGDARV